MSDRKLTTAGALREVFPSTGSPANPARMHVWQAREQLPPAAWAKLGGAFSHAIASRIVTWWCFSVCGEFGYAGDGDAKDDDQCCLRCQRTLARRARLGAADDPHTT